MSRHHQPSLFGAPESARGRGQVGPAAVPERLAAIACRLPPAIRLGTSSWSFPGWEGLVWDRPATRSHLARAGLAAYARHPLLRTVGIDRTYYAPIPAEAFAGYAAAVPVDFRFLVKAASLCTSPHGGEGGRRGERNARFLDAAFAAEEVVGPFVEGLGAKAGPLVFQFPPLGRAHTADPARFAGMLGEFLAALPRGPQYAVELRDRALLVPEYRSALEAASAVHCFTVHPRMPSPAAQRRLVGSRCHGPLVVRWMLRAGLGYEEAVQRYEPFSELVDEDPANRESLARIAAEEAQHGRSVVIVANNKAEGCAPRTAFELAASIARRLEEGPS